MTAVCHIFSDVLSETFSAPNDVERAVRNHFNIQKDLTSKGNDLDYLDSLFDE